MPELHSLYPGDELNLKAYPHLKQIIQLGHHTIRGVIKFKDAMVYANPSLSNFEIPENQANDGAFSSYQNGKEVASFTSGDLVQQSRNLWNGHFSSNVDTPVFISVNLETPLGLTSFLANNANGRKVYIPSSFNMNKILTSLKTQQSTIIVTDQELVEIEPPASKKAELSELTSSVNKIVVAGNKRVSASSLFGNARDFTTINPYTLQ
jgi:hypothetical protein